MAEGRIGAEGITELPQPVLPYADAAAQLGVFVFRDATMLRVVVPPLRGWRILAPWQWAVLAIAALRIVIGLQERHVFLIDPAAIAVLLAYKAYTFWRRRVFQVTAQAVGVGFQRGAGVMWQHEWPTSSVGEIKLNASNGRLLVRITGADIKEFRISGRQVVTKAVADLLQSALAEFR